MERRTLLYRSSMYGEDVHKGRVNQIIHLRAFRRRQTDQLAQFYNTLAYFVLVGYHYHLFRYLKKKYIYF